MKETEVRSLTQLVIVIYVFSNKIRNVYRKSGNEARIYKVIETSLRRPHCSSVCRLKFTLECFMTPNQRKKCLSKSRESSLKVSWILTTRTGRSRVCCWGKIL